MGGRQAPWADLLSAAEALLGSRWEPEPSLEVKGKHMLSYSPPFPSGATLWDLIAATR